MGLLACPETSRRSLRVPSAYIGLALLLMAETMLFASLISACILTRASSADWPPAQSSTLPVWVTAANMAALVASGLLVFRPICACGWLRARIGIAAMLGLIFVTVQGWEWLRVLSSASADAAYLGIFYTLLAVHGFHVLGGLTALVWLWVRLMNRPAEPVAVNVCRVYWLFVVAVWPVLYAILYH
jgi:cytochrome c oxidase subunit III